MFECPPVTPQAIFSGISGLSAAAAAIIAAFVAYQQWVVNRASLKERLFERRLQTFLEVQTYLRRVVAEATSKREWESEFNEAVLRSRFLFGRPTQVYLDSIREQAVGLWGISQRMKDLPVGHERSELAERERVSLVWLSNQLTEIYERFDPYLGFENQR